MVGQDWVVRELEDFGHVGDGVLEGAGVVWGVHRGRRK